MILHYSVGSNFFFQSAAKKTSIFILRPLYPDAMAGDTSKGGAYEIGGPPETKAWGIMKPIAQFGENRQYDRWIIELRSF